MANKAAVAIGVGAGIAGLIYLATREAKAAPPPTPPTAEIPTVDDIMGAKSITDLNAYYNLIGELYIVGKISTDEYMELYQAYEERWYQLTGGTE